MHHIVFLDRAILPSELRKPAFPHTWAEYPTTHDEEIVARLSGATIAISSKIPLRAAQELIDTKAVNVLVVSLKRTRDTDQVARSLGTSLGSEQLEVRRWEELNDFYAKTVDLYDRQFGVLQLIVLAMVLLSVTNTVNMTVFERTGEFGTMRALGNRGVDVFVLIFIDR